MSRKSVNLAEEQSVVARLPDQQAARALLRTPWSAVEVPSGRIVHRCKARNRAWSVPSLLIRTGASAGMLIFAEAYDDHGSERFGLRFRAASDNWSGKHIATARPPFAPVVDWPPGLEFMGSFAKAGPLSGELGLGVSLLGESEKVVPVLWARFGSEDFQVLLYADDEIPMNVGIAASMSASGENARVNL